MDRIIPRNKINYYKYYGARKEIYQMNYAERKRRNALEAEHKDYYKNYWELSLWKEDNMREYKKIIKK